METGWSIENARDALVTANSLGSYNEDSSQYKKLEYNVKKYGRDKSIAEQKMEMKWKSFEKLIGTELDGLPESLPENQPVLPSSEEPEENHSLLLARLGEKKAKATLEKQKESTIPELTIAVSYQLDVNDFSSTDDHILLGTFSGSFENLSISGSIGGLLDEKTFTASFGFSWSLADRRAEQMNILEEENSYEISVLQLEDAEKSFQKSINGIRQSIIEIEDRKLCLEEDLIIASLELAEAKSRLEVGIISQAAMNLAKWNLDKLKYDEYILLLDLLLIQYEIDELFFRKVEQQ